MTGPAPEAPPAERSKPRIVVGIATTDRPAIVSRTVEALAFQNRLPDLVIVSGHGPADFGGLPGTDLPFKLDLVTGPKGTCSQRNRILDASEANDILLFLDDDFLIAPDFLDRLARLFSDHPDIVMATGTVLADGILGPGLTFDEGAALLADAEAQPAGQTVSEVRNAYGCNMALRMAPARTHGLRFDEKLPLYGWFEDVDFSIRAAAHGRIVLAEALRGVHLGTKTGRTSGLRVGYSQVANPVYLYRKGVLGLGTTLWRVARNLASNLYHAARPLDWIDHRGRLRGNGLALVDLLRGLSDPERIIRL